MRSDHSPLITLVKGKTRVSCSCGMSLGQFSQEDVNQGKHKRSVQHHQEQQALYELREHFARR